MIQTSVSTKYQVVIPRAVRKKIKIKPGQKLSVYTSGNNIILTPNMKWPEDYYKELGDVWKGIDIDAYLEEERNSWGDR